MKSLLRTLWVGVGLCAGSAVIAADALVPIAPLVKGTMHEALFAIAFDQDAGVAVGAAGAILSTADGGKTWKPLASAPTQLSLLGVDIRQQRQIAVGQMGLVLLNEAGGGWQKMDTGTTERLFAVSTNSKGLTAAVGSFGTVLKSADGGHTWAAVAPDWTSHAEEGMQPHLYAVNVDEQGAITIAGEFGLILRSTDGGTNWKPVSRGDASIFALELREDGVGYAVGQDGIVLRTNDGGVRWSVVQVPTKAILLGVHSTSDGHIVMTGMREMLTSDDDGKTWKHSTDPNIAASWFSGVDQAGAGSPILAVGHTGQIIRVGG
jgi:photosystem II stability/assembly factor-like uncharacterized protein